MGFIFRTVFWLGLAMVILPPEARLGGTDGGTIDVRDIDLGLELHNAAYAVWGFGTQIAGACNTNPELCKAGMNLWKATASTTEGLALEVRDGWQGAPSAAAAVNPKQPKKIQARVE